MTVPQIPELSGIESFTGPAFHSARWDHTVDLTGKKVAVIGTGASAIQFVPIDRRASRCSCSCISAPRPGCWPGSDPSIPKSLRMLFAKVPLTRNIFRCHGLLGRGGAGHRAQRVRRSCTRSLEWAAKANIRKSIKDPALVAKLTPDYQIGCKRLLYSPTYYPALARPNVEVITDGIAEVRPESIVTVDGTERAVDVIIYATGFDVVDDRFDRSLNIRVGGGELMWQRWNTLTASRATWASPSPGCPTHSS